MDVTGIIGFVNLFDDISMLGSNCGDGLLQQCNILHPYLLCVLLCFCLNLRKIVLFLLSDFKPNVVIRWNFDYKASTNASFEWFIFVFILEYYCGCFIFNLL